MKLISSLILLVIAGLAAHADFPPPDDLLRGRMNNPLLKSEGTMTGEGVCWHAAYDMGLFMDAYRDSGDEGYLDTAVTYYDALIDKLHTSPDGYKGWVGPYIYDSDYIGDVHIGDAILINHMLDFSETILKKSDGELKARYEDKAREYLVLAQTHLIEKWDSRGTWREDGPYGAYVSWDRYMTPDNLDEWRKLDVKNSSLSLPFNKQNSMGIAALRIYRITGDEAYRGKALKIFNYMKSRMALFEDHYVWNYWEPFGPWDIDGSASNKLRHWVNVHPYRNYQAGEIHEIVEAYHSGLTFDRTDIERIINTNLNVMWNGDKDNPEWRNSNYAVQMAAYGELPIKEAPGGHFPNLAGALWTGLAEFSKTVRELAGRETDDPVDFSRNYDELPVTIFDRPFHSNKMFIMAASIPAAIKRGESANLVIQTRQEGAVSIELMSEDGAEVIETIRPAPEKHDYKGIHRINWNTGDIDAGSYRIRWTLNDEIREFPITIQ